MPSRMVRILCTHHGSGLRVLLAVQNRSQSSGCLSAFTIAVQDFHRHIDWDPVQLVSDIFLHRTVLLHHLQDVHNDQKVQISKGGYLNGKLPLKALFLPLACNGDGPSGVVSRAFPQGSSGFQTLLLEISISLQGVRHPWMEQRWRSKEEEHAILAFSTVLLSIIINDGKHGLSYSGWVNSCWGWLCS